MAADGQIEAVLEEVETLDPHFADAHSEVVFNLIRWEAILRHACSATLPQSLNWGLVISSNTTRGKQVSLCATHGSSSAGVMFWLYWKRRRPCSLRLAGCGEQPRLIRD